MSTGNTFILISSQFLTGVTTLNFISKHFFEKENKNLIIFLVVKKDFLLLISLNAPFNKWVPRLKKDLTLSSLL